MLSERILEEAQESPLPLRTNFYWTLIGNMVYMGCQWGILIVLAKIGSPQMVGQFALALAITAPVFMFTNLQLRGVQATDAKGEFLFRDYLGLRAVGTAVALFFVTAVVVWGRYGTETGFVILAVGLSKAFEALSDVFYGLFQRQEKMDYIAKSMMLKGPLSLAALCIAVVVTGSVFWGTMSLASSWLLILVAYDIRTGAAVMRSMVRSQEAELAGVEGAQASILPRWDREILSDLAWLALPVGVVTMLISLSTNIPRYYIAKYQGEGELGIFAAMAYMMLAGNTIIGALGQSASPKLAKYFAIGDLKEFKRILFRMLRGGVLLGVAGVALALVAGREILTFFYRPEYAEQINVFVLLMIAAAISYASSFFGTAVTAMRAFKVQVPIHCLNIFVVLIGSNYFIRRSGLTGAAWVIFFSAMCLMLAYFAVAHYTIKARQKESLLSPT